MATGKSVNSLQIWQIAKSNLRHNFIFNFSLAVAILALTPVIFGVTNLDTNASAVPLELFVSLIGIVLLTPVFTPEQNSEIEGVIQSKYVSTTYIYIIRVAYSIATTILLIGAFVLFMKMSGCLVTISLLCGTVASAMFLGSLGVFTSAVTSNTTVSYMIPVLYYAINYTGGGNLGKFYLFSMAQGDYSSKIWLFVSGVILITVALVIKQVSKKLK